jgi:phosphoribosyl 1,2-cyclic phosphodiesterase
MKVTLWGTRGSLATPGTATIRYGGNTSCVSVYGPDGTVLVLDAGTGIRPLGMALPRSLRRVDICLTHLHLDHIQGLGFFAPLYNPAVEVHIWGPASTTLSLRDRLMRYLSPPLFPLRLRELPCQLSLHETPCADFTIGEFRIASALICHPGPTVGYRITTADATLAYVTDHEPALGVPEFPMSGEWTSGYGLAAEADLPRVQHVVLFHHDPGHTDQDIDRLTTEAIAATRPTFAVTPGAEGCVFALGSH